jgi:hypothetical protein
VVILTHPFEFIKGDRAEPRLTARQPSESEPVAANLPVHRGQSSDFEAVSFASAAPSWLEGAPVAEPGLEGAASLRASPHGENKANDLIPAI